MDTGSQGNQVSRRRFLTILVGAIGGTIAAVTAVPLVGYFISPVFKKQKASLVAVGKVGDIAPGMPKYVEYERRVQDAWETKTVRKAIWLVTTDGKDIVAFDPHCTHLGCPYSWTTEPWDGPGPYHGQPHFQCPCHGGRFAVDGTVLGGPPPRPLDRLEVQVQDGSILVGDVMKSGA